MRIGYNARLTIYLLLVSLLTVAFCLLASGYVADTAQALENQLAEVRSNVLAEDWEAAAASLRQGIDSWQQARPLWLGLLNHQEVSSIDLALHSLQSFGQSRRRDEVLNQLSLLDYYLRLTVESDRLTWSNLF